MKRHALTPHRHETHPLAALRRPLAVIALTVLPAAALTGCDALHCFLPSPAGDETAKTGQRAQTTGGRQITLEVSFLSVQDDFFQRIGIDFDFDIDALTSEAQGVFDPFGFGLGDCSLDNLPKAGPSSLTGGADNAHHLIPPRFLGGPLPLLLLPLDVMNNTVRTFPTLPRGFDGSTGLSSVISNMDNLRTRTEPLFDPSLQPGLSLLGTLLDDIQLDVILQAVAQSSNDRILSAPQITLFSNQRAIIMEAQEHGAIQDFEPAIASHARSIDPDAQTLNTGIVLDIRPRISSDGKNIVLTLFPGTRGARLTVADEQIILNNQLHALQLPVLQLSQVQTTVSVPDGGTILLGGLKTSPNGERQMGLPILSKIPLINRLFKNEAFLRETDSLLLMVTPRIIIQDEEEQ